MQKSQKIKTLDYNLELYVNANYSKIEQILSDSDDVNSLAKLAKCYLINGKYIQASNIYEKLGDKFLQGYANLLGGNLAITQKLWDEVKETSPLIAWEKSLIGFINLHVTKYPTYFQIRNFLEVDLNMLLTSGQKSYAQNIMSGLNIFTEINPEAYKYVARVLLNHKYYSIAIQLLEKSLDIYYKDPETHFMLAKSHLYMQNNTQATKYLKTCLSFHKDYFPAKKLLNFLKNN